MSQSADKQPVIPAWMPESSHKDVKLGVATKPFSNTYATGMSPSLGAGFRHPCRNDGNGAIMRIAVVSLSNHEWLNRSPPFGKLRTGFDKALQSLSKGSGQTEKSLRK